MKKKKRFDTVAILLLALFAFIFYGVFFSGCKKEDKNEEVTTENTASPNNYNSKKKTVVLDAAFGGELRGYQGIIDEADLNARVVEAIKERLE